MLFGEERKIIKIAFDVSTKEYGTAGSMTYFFVSGIGMVAHDLSDLTQIEYLTPQEIITIRTNITEHLSAFNNE